MQGNIETKRLLYVLVQGTHCVFASVPVIVCKLSDTETYQFEKGF